MTDKNLSQLLKEIGEVKPSVKWKEANRQILLSQINSGNFEAAKLNLSAKTRVAVDFIYNGFVKQLSQPVLATVLVFVLLAGGSLYSLSAASESTPGDSLYTAKIIGEKTQMALTFGDKNKTKLNIEFAENRVNELAKVLSDDSVNGEKKAKVEKLAGSFKKEIASVKHRIEKINADVKSEPIASEPTEGAVVAENEGDDLVFSANLGKGDDGLSISDSDTEKDKPAEEDNTATEPEAEIVELEIPELKTDTTTADIVKEGIAVQASSSDEAMETPQTKSQTIFDEAKQLLEEENYDAIIEKLDEVVSHVDSEVAQSKVEVKGVAGEAVEEEAIIDEGTVEDVAEEEVVEDTASSTLQ